MSNRVLLMVKISEGAMIETDTIHGNMYGTSYAAVNLVVSFV